MRIPKSIKPGDTIGLVAPSFGATIEPYKTRLESAIRKFEQRGYKVRAAESCYMDDGLGISTDPVKAAKDLMDFYLDDSIDAVISVGGGELMDETISHVDFEKLKSAPPKWYLGYSDNTNMIFPMVLICVVAGIYGPCATGFGKNWEATEEYTFAILEGTQDIFSGLPFFELPDDETRSEDPLAPYHLTAPRILRSFIPENASSPAVFPAVGSNRNPASSADSSAAASAEHASAALKVPSAAAESWFKEVSGQEVSMEGLLLGGCLDILENLSGTKYAPVPEFLKTSEPVIWAIEACDLSVLDIRRTLWHLRAQGWFDNAAGFLFGRPLAAFHQEFGPVNAYNAVTGPLAGLPVPIIMDAEIGHIAPMLPLVMGSHVRISVSGNDLTLKMDLN